MSEEILVNVTPRETRVAVVENGMLQELHIERGWRRGVVGNIYKGKVQRVMPGMQAAFVEIGLDRAAFLHANDIFKPSPVPSDEGDAVALPPSPPRPITELLREGQDVVVQVVKDPIGGKGARLTTQLSIPSRYLVLLPQSRVIGVSARIEDEVERARLKSLVNAARLAMVIMYVPDISQLHHPESQLINRVLLKTCQQLSIPFVDMTPVFEQSQDPSQYYLWPEDPHTNRVGHEEMAATLEEVICSLPELRPSCRFTLKRHPADMSNYPTAGTTSPGS